MLARKRVTSYLQKYFEESKLETNINRVIPFLHKVDNVSYSFTFGKL